jgi:hypothetical protein
MATPDDAAHREVHPLAIAPLDVDGVKVIAVGTVAWAIATLVMLVVDRHSWWLWVCVAGLGLGVIGVPIQHRYQRRLR